MPLSILHKAAYQFEQLSGIDAAISWHERELERLRAIRATLEAPQAADGDDGADAEDLRRKLAIAEEVIEFYADPMNWMEPRGKPSMAAKDKGGLARKAMTDMDEGETEEAAE